MTGKRTNVAVWHEKYHRWQIKVQKDGVRKTFYSMQPGRTGQRECHKKADEWLESNVASANDKCSKILDAWLNEMKQISNGKSMVRFTDNKSIANNWIYPYIGRKQICKITEQDLQNILNSAYEAGRAEKTIRNIRGSIMLFLKFARKCGATTLRPDDLNVPKSWKKKKKILQPNHIKILFTTPDTDEFYIHAFQFLVSTGLRRGELVALQTKRDINGNVLHVQQSVNRLRETTDGKTENANRTFILTSAQTDIILDQINLLRRLNIKSSYLFPNMHGERLNPNYLYDRWTAYQKKVGLDHISLHELRHTFISMCKDVPLHLLKLQVGHSPNMDTFGQYGHMVDGEMEEAAKKIETAFNDVLK